MSLRPAERTRPFTESVIREMTRVAGELGAVNLAQGFPDFAAPAELKQAAARAIAADHNQYAVTWGAPPLRRALASAYRRWYGRSVDPDRELTVTCGATEAMASVFLALLDPGDEVLVLEPFYENYGPDAILAGARPVHVPLSGPRWELDPERIEAAATERTRAIVVNSPNNPTGRVFSRDELGHLARLCRERDWVAITDEIYEHILYSEGHHPLAGFEGMAERTVTVSGASKTFAVTGWRVGWIVAPAALTGAIRKVHDFLTVGAPAPLQIAVAEALDTLGADYYSELASSYRERRDVLVSGLRDAGFRCVEPEGAYYVLADFSDLDGRSGSDSFARRLGREAGVVPVPGHSFYRSGSGGGEKQVRFAFCKRLETLVEASDRLREFGRASGISR